MQPVTRIAIVFTILSTLVQGSARGAPPLDQLPLRDALLARPEVVAELAPEARRRLAERFEEARQRPQPYAAVLGEPDAQPLDLVRSLDLARLGEHKDAVVAAQLVLSPAGVEPREFTDEPTEPQGALPSLDGVLPGATAEAEAGALTGTAGVVLSRLLRQSEAKRMVRVQSWPVGAIAIRGTVYVNAAWLVALSPVFSETPPRKDSADPTRPKDATAHGGGVVARPSAAPAEGQHVESGCGGSVGSVPPSGAAAPVSSDRAQEPMESASESGAKADPSLATNAAGRGPIDLPLRRGTEEPERGGSGIQTLWSGTRTAGTGTREGSVESLTYALDNGSGAPVDCCRYNSERGCDTTTPCDTPSSSCNSSDGSGCNSNTGSGCSSGSSGSGCNSGSSGSGCNSGSSGSGCNSGSSGSGCNSGSSSGSGCSSGSSSSSGSCSSSGSSKSCSSGSCGKCEAAPVRPRGDIPDPVTLLFLMAPLGFLMLEGRRRHA